MLPTEPGFSATPNKDNFLAVYLDVLENGSTAEASSWLLANASLMDEAMFLSPEVGKFAPIELMVLRACAPLRVFTQVGKGSYLAQVTGNTELTELSEVLFTDNDFDFVTKLPDEVKAEIGALMLIAYGHKIRPSNQRVRAMFD